MTAPQSRQRSGRQQPASANGKPPEPADDDDGNPVVEAEVVPETSEATVTANGGALERREVRNEVLMPLDPDQVVAGMEAYQKLLPRLLNQGDWQQTDDGRFVKKSGWRKIARAFNLSLEVVQTTVGRDEDGAPVRAHVIARAIAPNGSYQDGDGYCSIDENRFAGARGRLKLENDLRATATTRAKNRAISDLVGMGEVSAEEVQAGGAGGIAEATPQSRSRASRALTYLLDDEEAAERTWGEIKQASGGVMPETAAQALILAAGALRETRGGQDATADPPQATGPTATPRQQRTLMKECRDHGLVDARQQQAIYQWVAGESHLDRLPKEHVTATLKAVRDHQATLDEIRARADDGDAQAQLIVSRYLTDREEARDAA